MVLFFFNFLNNWSASHNMKAENQWCGNQYLGRSGNLTANSIKGPSTVLDFFSWHGATFLSYIRWLCSTFCIISEQLPLFRLPNISGTYLPFWSQSSFLPFFNNSALPNFVTFLSNLLTFIGELVVFIVCRVPGSSNNRKIRTVYM